MIKFGSCTEIYMDKNVEICIEKGQPYYWVAIRLSGGFVMNKSVFQIYLLVLI